MHNNSHFHFQFQANELYSGRKTCVGKFLFVISLALIFGFTFTELGISQTAGSKYFSDFETVNKIANLLEDGKIDEYLVYESVAVNDRDGYYILVKLSNGETRRLNSRDFLKLTKSNRIELSNNYILIEEDGNKGLQFFDRNAFGRQAFSAKVFIYKPPLDSPYAGFHIPYLINKFVLLKSSESSTDPMTGEKYSYLMSFKNGSSLMLTASQAFESFKRNAFNESVTKDVNLFGKPNQVSYISTMGKENLASGASQVIIEVGFKEAIVFDSAYLISEVKKVNLKSRDQKNSFFYIDSYFPNTEFDQRNLNSTLPRVSAFDKIVLLSDKKNLNSSLVRAYLKQDDYSFLGSLPIIEIRDSKKIWIRYLSQTDQTSSNFDYAIDAPTSSPDLRQFSDEFAQTQFHQAFSIAVSKINSSDNKSDIKNQIQDMLDGISLLDQAGARVDNDEQLKNIILAKKQARSKIYKKIISYLKNGVRSKNFDSRTALNLIEQVEPFVIGNENLKELIVLKQKISIN